MSEENNKPSDDAKNIPIAEILIATGLDQAQKQNMTLGELVGHYEVAKIEVYNRITAGAKAAAQTDAPAEDGDTEKIEDALTVEDGGKA